MTQSNTNTIKERLNIIIADNGLSVRAFEKKCGFSTGYVQRITDKMGMNMVMKVLNAFPTYSKNWLIYGEGEMLQSDDLAVPQNNDLVPELPIDAAAGFTDDIQQGVSPSMCAMLPRIPGIPGYDLTMHVRGDSMQPTFESGDRLAIRRCYDFIEWGVPHVLDTTEGVYLKRIREDRDNILCHSDNADYPPFPIPKSCIRGIYKVVALLRVC